MPKNTGEQTLVFDSKAFVLRHIVVMSHVIEPKNSLHGQQYLHGALQLIQP